MWHGNILCSIRDAVASLTSETFLYEKSKWNEWARAEDAFGDDWKLPMGFTKSKALTEESSKF